MASRRVTTLIDDVDGKNADESVVFSLDGIDYEIDLGSGNAARLRSTLAPWAEKGRRAGQARTRRALQPVGDSRRALIRAWAAREGLDVPARGRIPGEVQRQYEARR